MDAAPQRTPGRRPPVGGTRDKYKVYNRPLLEGRGRPEALGKDGLVSDSISTFAAVTCSELQARVAVPRREVVLVEVSGS